MGKRDLVYDSIEYCGDEANQIPDHLPTRGKAAAFSLPVGILDGAIAGAIGGAITGAGFSMGIAVAVGVPATVFALFTYAMCSAAGCADERAGY